MATALEDRANEAGRRLAARADPGRAWRALQARPAALFAALSIFFGALLVFLNPPLRGPDEPAHFVRVYGFVHGDLVPGERVDGRLGLRLPAALHDDFEFYAARRWRGEEGRSYRGVLAERLARKAERPAAGADRPAVFVPYEGSEGYSPAAYLPQIAAGLAARAFGFDFLVTLYLMRSAGLIAMTAVCALAIAAAPRLKWCFLLLAMWPAALYGRAVVSADGAAFSFALLVAALSLRGALAGEPGQPAARAVWLALCALAKPPNLAFVLLECLGARLRDWRDGLRRAAVVAPAVALAPLWAGLVSCELAAWRLTESGVAQPQELDPAWKLAYMLERPLAFPAAVLASLAERPIALWREAVGVLGWSDAPLRAPVYVAVTALLVVAALVPLGVERRRRAQLVLVAGLAALAYAGCVYLILFLAWTPVGAPTVWGVQGRYFVPALPALAMAFAALADRQLAPWAPAAAAVSGALLSGAGALEAILRQHWWS